MSDIDQLEMEHPFMKKEEAVKEYTLPEAVKWMAENPDKELIDDAGCVYCFDDETGSFLERKGKFTWSEARFCSNSFTHPEPKPEPVTLANLGRFRRVTVEWPEDWGSKGNGHLAETCFEKGSNWEPSDALEIDLALRMGLNVTGEVDHE